MNQKKKMQPHNSEYSIILISDSSVGISDDIQAIY